jgi:hypothetical protein
VRLPKRSSPYIIENIIALAISMPWAVCPAAPGNSCEEFFM